MPLTNLGKRKIFLLAIGVILFLGWLIWYLVSYLSLEHKTVLSIAAQSFNCPSEQIKLGASHQTDDGPKEIPVRGCGKSGTILCSEYTASHGFLSEYRSFDVDCSFEAKSLR